MKLAKVLPFNPKDSSAAHQTGVSEKLCGALRPIQKSRKIYIELDGLSRLLKDALDKQKQHLDSFASSFNELAASSEEITSTNQTVLAQAERSLKDTEDGTECVDQLKKVSHELSVAQTEFTDLMKVMNSIRASTNLINDIVFQTKLLSFNASVEAARAGEHGKGFSVVAGMVKNLADSSKKTADEISEKIETGMASVDRLVKLLTEGVDNLVRNSETTAQKFENIKGNVGSLTSSMRQVMAGMENQSSAINSSLGVLNEFSELNERNGEFTQKSISGLSKELSTAVEEVSATTKDALEFVGGGRTKTNEFWDKVDEILMQIKDKRDALSSLQTIAYNVARMSDWKIAHVLTPDADGVTRSSGVWSMLEGQFKTSKFYSMSSGAQFNPGQGLPGRVYKSKHFEYIENVTNDANFPRRQAAEEVGLVSAIGVPILTRDKRVVAVIEFFSFSQIKPDPTFIEALEQMGEVVGSRAI